MEFLNSFSGKLIFVSSQIRKAAVRIQSQVPNNKFSEFTPLRASFSFLVDFSAMVRILYKLSKWWALGMCRAYEGWMIHGWMDVSMTTSNAAKDPGRAVSWNVKLNVDCPFRLVVPSNTWSVLTLPNTGCLTSFWVCWSFRFCGNREQQRCGCDDFKQKKIKLNRPNILWGETAIWLE